MSKQLEVNKLSVSFGKVNVINDISFSLAAGRIGCILGPSGCGKTTALRTIAGFQQPTKGYVLLGNKQISSPQKSLPPEKRNIGMVFQDFALFPNLTVADNIRFGLRNWTTDAQQKRIDELLELIGLKHLATAYSHQLSGGQQQRVALARAMAPKPDILLLDEPFSSMDIDLREQLAREVRNILKQENITAILVTHDQHEAFVMADEICVMHDGIIQQHDTGYNLYHKPANKFVADFIGQGVIITGEAIDTGKIKTELGIIEGSTPEGCQPGCKVDVLIRPDDVIHDDESNEQAIIIDKAFKGAEFLYTLRTRTGVEVLCLAPSHHNHQINESIGIRLDIDHLVVFKQ
ncbi:MAG: ABC transporter ATP-binding protein [Gammaproteobacteria bacterium]|nr:ABC transporter ATP-binding protein [Gammaproteobacteria bacterium]